MQTFMMNYKNRHPWMTGALRSQIKHKNKLHSFASRDDISMEAYKVAKKALQSSLRNTEIAYFSNRLGVNKNDIGKTWKVINVILGLGKSRCKKHLSFLIDNEYVTDSLQLAKALNNFFVSISSQLAKDIVSDVNPLSYVTNNVNSIVILDVTCNQVRNVISSLNNSSAGYDELPPFVAKSCVDGFIEPIYIYG